MNVIDIYLVKPDESPWTFIPRWAVWRSDGGTLELTSDVRRKWEATTSIAERETNEIRNTQGDIEGAKDS